MTGSGVGITYVFGGYSMWACPVASIPGYEQRRVAITSILVGRVSVSSPVIGFP